MIQETVIDAPLVIRLISDPKKITMAAAEGGLGGSCFFEGDCEVPLVCEVEGVGGKTLTCKISFY